MTIKVAYDISQLASNVHRTNNKTGIIRVIEEVLFELQKRCDINLKMVGLCTNNAVFTSLVATQYLKQIDSNMDSSFIDTYTSRLGIESYYKRKYATLLSTDIAKEIHKDSLPSYIFRAMLMVFSYIQKLDLVQSLKDDEFDIFHSPFLKLPPRKITGITKRLLTIYDLIPVKNPEYVTRHFNLFFKQILQSIDVKRDWVICISEHTKNEFCEYTKMSPDRVFVAPLAASDNFHPVDDMQRIDGCRKKYGIPPGQYFLTLALLQPRKNLDHLIRSFFKFLAESHRPDTYLVLAGFYGWKYSEIFNTLNKFPKYRSRLIFTGYVPDEDLAAIYSGAKGFLFPSLYEGFGLPPLEAMKCGVPVITSNTTSLPEVVGDAGIMVDPLDQDALCQAMTTIVNDDNVWQELRAKGLERSRQFTWTASANKTAEVYKQVLTGQ